MIFTVFRISLLRLLNSRQELALVFIVPVLFFSIFALIFSRGVGTSVSQVKVSFVDDDNTPASTSLIRAACANPEIEAVTGIGSTTTNWPIDSLSRLLISECDVEVVVHIPAGFTTQNPDAPHLSIQLLDQGINPIGHRLVQAALAEAIGMQLAEANLSIAKHGSAPVRFAAYQPTVMAPAASQATGPPALPASKQTVFSTRSAFATGKHQPKIAMYAAGIAVMFLLFSANGAGASLLEEREAGTMGRLLSSRLTLTELLLGKWCYIFIQGCLQLTVMFAWAQVAFQVDLLGHLMGFSVMTLCTSAAAASFALLLAVLCKSRQQLQAVALVLVLSMSALGGSMVPRYIMTDNMRALGRFTFNGWALDGFQKIFWYDMPVSNVSTEALVLVLIAAVLGLLASFFSVRWSRGVQL